MPRPWPRRPRPSSCGSASSPPTPARSRPTPGTFTTCSSWTAASARQTPSAPSSRPWKPRRKHQRMGKHSPRSAPEPLSAPTPPSPARTSAMPGNTANLQKATAARTAAAAARAENALAAMIREGEQVTFRGLASRAGVSLDFLYRNAGIRGRIERHRTARPARPEPADPGGETASSVVRTLTAQLSDLKRRHREETAVMRQALEQAHGENLLLRRRLAAGGQAEPGE